MSSEMNTLLFVGIFSFMVGGWFGHVTTLRFLFEIDKKDEDNE